MDARRKDVALVNAERNNMRVTIGRIEYRVYQSICNDGWWFMLGSRILTSKGEETKSDLYESPLYCTRAAARSAAKRLINKIKSADIQELKL